ncbi:MAG: TonB-dependent receptor domain-containing protein [Terriglobia bacterium]
MTMRQVLRFFLCFGMICALAGFEATPLWGQAQSNAVDLSGTVADPQGAVVPGASVTVRHKATNATRTATTDEIGVYRILALPPGVYEVTVEAPGFARVVNPELRLELGRAAQYHVALEIRPGQEEVIVTGETLLVETQRTAVAETVTQRRIENLPINQRDYLNFSLLTSNVVRDSAPSIGAAPTSGINFAGQRARSNLVTVDGADATDNSINGVRSTVSQEAVQEFQIVSGSYMPEFGRAGGGVINIVTRGGTNEFHGNVFGFLRHKSVQARNPFSNVSDPAFTRVQAGVTLGGPIVQDRTFFFISYETRRRQEAGFSSIGAGNFGFIPFPGGFLLTADQAAFVTDPTLNAIPGVGPFDLLDGVNTVLDQYFVVAAGAAGTAVNGTNLFSGPFILSCPGAPAPPCLPVEPLAPGGPELQHFVPLSQLTGNYPATEATSFYSVRLDHQFNPNHLAFLRVSVTPSTVDGIQVNAQNQTFGQNAFSRTSLQDFRDQTVVSQLTSTLGPAFFNQFRFQFARRALSYRFAEAPGGDQVAINIGGFAFFGREPFSSIDRIERRWQLADTFSWLKGRHTFKFGVDVNVIDIAPRGGNQIFQLNFGGLYNFGALGATTSGFPSSIAGISVPGFNAVQAYGLGIPQIFIQGLGDSNSPFTLKTFAWFAQDSWRLRPNLTLNYGVRYDIEFSPIFRPGGPSVNDAGSQLIGQAEQVLGVVEGLRRDEDNFSPRVGVAWDPWGDSKTVIRAAYGLYFDHPLLALAFNSNTADGSQSVQQFVPPGSPNPASFNAASLFQGILTAPPTFGYLPTQGRFDPFLSNSTFINLNFCPQPTSDSTRVCADGPVPLAILPWTLPTQANFEYAYMQQGNLSIERQLFNDFTLSVRYNYVRGLHLNRPRNINSTNPDLLAFNFLAAVDAGCNPADPRFFDLALCDPVRVSEPVPGLGGILLINVNPGPFFGAPIGQPFAFNYFRASGPNLAFTGPLGIPDAAVAALVGAANGALAGIGSSLQYAAGPGFFIPFSDVNMQESSGDSVYHGLTLDFSKRFSHNYEFLASYTWSHAIDDSTDLQTLLNPQNNRRPDERGNSTFDLRHRFVLSGVFQSGLRMSDTGFWKKFLADWIFAPIVEIASGRPFTVLAGSDNNFDFGSATDRPNVVPADPSLPSSPFLPGVSFTSPSLAADGNLNGTLGRNTFRRPMIAVVDFRLSRRFKLSERFSLEWINDFFNIFNRFNVGDVNPLCDGTLGGTCIAGQPTSALDPRQYQLGLKLIW